MREESTTQRERWKQSGICPWLAPPQEAQRSMSKRTTTPSLCACRVAEELTRCRRLALHSLAASRLEISVWLNAATVVAGRSFLGIFSRASVRLGLGKMHAPAASGSSAIRPAMTAVVGSPAAPIHTWSQQ